MNTAVLSSTLKSQSVCNCSLTAELCSCQRSHCVDDKEFTANDGYLPPPKCQRLHHSVQQWKLEQSPRLRARYSAKTTRQPIGQALSSDARTTQPTLNGS
eukprot:3834611-Amphidinium_carterae.1